MSKQNVFDDFEFKEVKDAVMHLAKKASKNAITPYTKNDEHIFFSYCQNVRKLTRERAIKLYTPAIKALKELGLIAKITDSAVKYIDKDGNLHLTKPGLGLVAYHLVVAKKAWRTFCANRDKKKT